MGMGLKLTDFEKELIEEISVLSGFPSLVVREVLEAALLRQLELLLSRKDIAVPFLGTLFSEHIEDKFIDGKMVASIKCQFNPSNLLKCFVGSIQNGESDLINSLLQKKIKGTLQEIIK